MTQYIIGLIERMQGNENDDLSKRQQTTWIVAELDRLDPRDFLPDARADFIITRQRLRIFVEQGTGGDMLPSHLADICTMLRDYGGEGSRAVKREFPFISKTDLKKIIERDYRELSTILFPSGAWKSVVVLAGSILEAILQDQLTKDAATTTTAKASTAYSGPPGKRAGLEACGWRLVDLIAVAVDIGIIPKGRADAIDETLREYRNFVHPAVELRKAHPCNEAEALLAKGALDAVCNHLTP